MLLNKLLSLLKIWRRGPTKKELKEKDEVLQLIRLIRILIVQIGKTIEIQEKQFESYFEVERIRLENHQSFKDHLDRLEKLLICKDGRTRR